MEGAFFGMLVKAACTAEQCTGRYQLNVRDAELRGKIACKVL